VFALGDIIKFLSPTAGKEKYHLCVQVGIEGAASQFLFLNSDPTFAHTFVVECARVPCLPVSQTGKTAFSLAMIPRLNDRQLGVFRAEKMGDIDRDLAAELCEFAKTVPTLTRSERALVVAALKTISETPLAAPST
jgi:hypothetical protein